MRIFFAKLSFLFFFSWCLFQLGACDKNQFIQTTGAGLNFSVDTLMFDTVFTNLGNATRRFKVYNPHNQPIKINRAYLAGGNSSDFKINIDGFPGPSNEAIDIPALDSIYVFATVFIDPNNGDAIREDSILFETDGGGVQSVVLNAYGWNANYLQNVRFVNQNLTLSNTKPYIFIGLIAIDSGSCLTIPAGTEIFMFGGPSTRPGTRARLFIGHNSCIRSNVGGNLNNPVEFKTHRLEEDYQPIAFHHDGIFLSKTSRDNVIHGTIIRNAVDGVIIDSFSVNGSPKVEFNNCKIFNVDRSGILSRGGYVKMTNTVIANSNQFNFLAIRGGLYDIRHCTFANIATGYVSRSEPVLSYRNYEIQIINDVETIVSDAGTAYFTNCIIYGNQKEEVEILAGSANPQNFNYTFTNCLMKLDTFGDAQPQVLVDCIKNQDPMFVDAEFYDHSIDTTGSPANDAGTAQGIGGGATGPSTDIIGTARSNSTPAIGAYEILN